MMTRKSLVLALTIALAPAASMLQGCAPVAVASMGAVVVIADDRRSTGMYIEDENIEWKIVGKAGGTDFQGAHVNTTSFNRRVLITGEVPTEEGKMKVEEAVRKIANVRDVVNELKVGAISSFASRGNDALITSNVKARMVNNGKFSPNHVKVVTEANVVYLMGLVKQAEGDAAAEIARTTQGVSRVVKVFEYIS
jgi:osmotically-inducible protein OsmY